MDVDRHHTMQHSQNSYNCERINNHNNTVSTKK